jgi:hypothetical protein
MKKPYLEESTTSGEEMTVVMTYSQMSDIRDALETAGNADLTRAFDNMIDAHQDGIYFSSY